MDATKIAFCPVTGCHLWTAYIDAKGYGTVRCGGKVMKAHRVAYEEIYGPIPKGLVIDHLCRVRSCVNPDHLRAVTPSENTHAPGSEAIAEKYSARDRCDKCGGAFTIAPRGERACRNCINAYHREWWAKKRGAIRD